MSAQRVPVPESVTGSLLEVCGRDGLSPEGKTRGEPCGRLRHGGAAHNAPNLDAIAAWFAHERSSLVGVMPGLAGLPVASVKNASADSSGNAMRGQMQCSSRASSGDNGTGGTSRDTLRPPDTLWHSCRRSIPRVKGDTRERRWYREETSHST